MQKKRTNRRIYYLYFFKVAIVLFLIFQFKLYATPLLAQYKLTVKGESITLSELFAIIKKQTGLTVFYSNELLNDKERVAVNFKDASLEEALEYLLKNKNIAYE